MASGWPRLQGGWVLRTVRAAGPIFEILPGPSAALVTGHVKVASDGLTSMLEGEGSWRLRFSRFAE